MAGAARERGAAVADGGDRDLRRRGQAPAGRGRRQHLRARRHGDAGLLAQPAGALLLESLESARERGARIYAEILGGAVNSGGQRGGGSMTAANDEGIQRCIRAAISDAGIAPEDINVINGHLTATSRDPHEIRNWCEALGLQGKDFPAINSFKDVLGHGLAASGSMECVATILQYAKGRIFGNTNAADTHPEILEHISPASIPLRATSHPGGITAKASFGFGDVNSCLIFKPI